MKNLKTSLTIAPIIALTLAGCEGSLQQFASSVDEMAASIVSPGCGEASGAIPDREAEQKYRLALRHLDEGAKQNDARAVPLLREAADAGVADAEFRLGRLYQTGQGVPQDDEAAAAWFQRAAGQDHAEAQFSLGNAYQSGRGVAQDDRAAVACFARAATAGHAAAQYELGLAYAAGKGVAKDDVKALQWFESAADLGHRDAQYAAGRAYSNGWGTQLDHAWAARWYGKAAEQGHAKAQHMLAVAYAEGIGLPRDGREAFKWTILAAAQGDEDAVRLRKTLERTTPRAEIEQATALARRWKPSTSGSFADPPTVRFVQLSLYALGLQPGPVDGRIGPRTRAALTEYEARAGIDGNGALKPDVLQRLKADRLRHDS